MTKPLTQADISGKCDSPGCTQDHGAVYITQACHPKSGCHARYEKGILTLTCRTCDTFVAQFAIAKGGN